MLAPGLVLQIAVVVVVLGWHLPLLAAALVRLVDLHHLQHATQASMVWAGSLQISPLVLCHASGDFPLWFVAARGTCGQSLGFYAM